MTIITTETEAWAYIDETIAAQHAYGHATLALEYARREGVSDARIAELDRLASVATAAYEARSAETVRAFQMLGELPEELGLEQARAIAEWHHENELVGAEWDAERDMDDLWRLDLTPEEREAGELQISREYQRRVSEVDQAFAVLAAAGELA